MRALLLLMILVPVAAFAQTPAAVERELIGYAKDINKYGNYAGAENADKLDASNTALKNALIKYGKRADILAFPFSKLKDEVDIATSPDGRFRVYSWDLSNGGSMHNFDNVFQYKGKSGKVLTWTRTSEASDDSGSFYTQVFETDAPDGPIYLGTSTFISSNIGAGQIISAFRINGDELDTNAKVIKTASGFTNSISFGYDPYSVKSPQRPVKLVFYNDSTKSFRFPVVIDDEKNPEGKVTDRFITYRFDGQYFVKVN